MNSVKAERTGRAHAMGAVSTAGADARPPSARDPTTRTELDTNRVHRNVLRNALRNTVAAVMAVAVVGGGGGVAAGADGTTELTDDSAARPDTASLSDTAVPLRTTALSDTAALSGAAALSDTATRPESDARSTSSAVHHAVWQTRAKPRSGSTRRAGTRGRSKAYAFRRVAHRSWPGQQFQCLDNLWTRESNWNHRAYNSGSGAYGIPQALPGWKMSLVALDWRLNPRTQIRWGLKYIKGRYGSPCGAWGHFRSHNWY